MGLFSRDAKPLVLIIDDDPNLIAMLGDMVGALGCDVASALNGRDGLDAAKRLKPRVIFLDMMMPGIGGLETLRELKAGPETKAVPVVMVTAEQKGKDIEAAYALGAAGYVIKPARMEAVKKRLEAALAAPSP